jgi:predicted transcriptional regulator
MAGVQRTNMELKERIRALQLELEQDRSRIINQAVSGDYVSANMCLMIALRVKSLSKPR